MEVDVRHDVILAEMSEIEPEAPLPSEIEAALGSADTDVERAAASPPNLLPRCGAPRPGGPSPCSLDDSLARVTRTARHRPKLA